MTTLLTDALRNYGLIDDQNYLVPPQHPSVDALTRRMAQLLELQADGLKLGPQDLQRLRAMQTAFDYYNEAVADWEEHGDEDDDSFVVDDVDDGDDVEASYSDSGSEG